MNASLNIIIDTAAAHPFQKWYGGRFIVLKVVRRLRTTYIQNRHQLFKRHCLSTPLTFQQMVVASVSVALHMISTCF